MTPFLRWSTGDIGVLRPTGATTGILSAFPVFNHSARTSGFFKVRGININHSEFEDFMHRNPAVIDFRLEVTDSDTTDTLRLQIELLKDVEAAIEVPKLRQAIKNTYEVTPHIEVLETGGLAQLFLMDVKAKRFVDSRSK